MNPVTDKTSAKEMEELPTLHRAALGSVAYLGDLYDARRDDFCGISIFKNAIPEAAKTLVDSAFTDSQFINSDSFSNKTSVLDVSAELKVSVMSGMVKVEGSGRYLNDKKTSARSVKTSLLYNTKTKKETLIVFHEDLKPAYSTEAIEIGMATHFVSAIEWGANSIITVQFDNNEDEEIQKIEGKLHAELNKASLSISGDAEVHVDDGNKNTDVRFDVKVTGDVLPKDGELPTTLEEAVELMKKMPILIADSNAGKGRPLSFRLLPIALLKDYLGFQLKVDGLITSLNAGSLVRVGQLFDRMNEVKQSLNDFYQDTFTFRGCVPQKDLDNVTELMDKIQTQEASFRSELSTALIDIRSGKAQGIILEDLIKNIYDSEVSPDKVTEQLVNWKPVMDRIKFARLVIKNGGKYIGIGSSLDEEIDKNFQATVYILFFSKEGQNDFAVWGENRAIFLEEMKKYKDEKDQEKEKEKGKNQKKDQVQDNVFLVVDYDLHPNQQLKSASSGIQVMKRSKILISDLRVLRERIRHTSWVQFGEGNTKRTWEGAPTRRAPLTLDCPGKNCTSSLIHDWHCTICMSIVEYGFDEYFYCLCGKSPATVVKFKCSEKTHGDEFVQHAEKYVLQALYIAPPFGELNILVFGESAEKQSAWMNEFVAFLRGDQTVQLTSNGTSNGTANGTSNGSTEHSLEPDRTIYLFEVGSTTIRFISGPELNKTPNDGELKQLLSNMPYMEKINAICVLFNVDNDVMNDMFGNLFQKFTGCFGKEASKNILFSFGSTSKHNSGIRPQVQLRLDQLLYANNDKKIDVSQDAVFIFDSRGDNIVEANRMAKRMRQLKPLVNEVKIESEYSTSRKLDGDIDAVFSLFKSGLRPGNAVNIKGFFMPNWEKFELLLSEDKTRSSVPFAINMVKNGDATVIKFEKGGSIAGPQIKEEQLFDLKIICEKDGFRVEIFGKKIFSQKPLVPADRISFVLLAARKFNVTTITVTKV